jgi:hypothetical protein
MVEIGYTQGRTRFLIVHPGANLRDFSAYLRKPLRGRRRRWRRGRGSGVPECFPGHAKSPAFAQNGASLGVLGAAGPFTPPLASWPALARFRGVLAVPVGCEERVLDVV